MNQQKVNHNGNIENKNATDWWRRDSLTDENVIDIGEEWYKCLIDMRRKSRLYWSNNIDIELMKNDMNSYNIFIKISEHLKAKKIRSSKLMYNKFNPDTIQMLKIPENIITFLQSKYVNNVV